MRQLYSFLSILLAATLTTPPLTAQAPLPPSETAKGPSLQVRLQASDAAAMLVNSISPNGYTLLVLDAAGSPVAGAAVALRMPEDGPSGTFADGHKALVAYTDSKGMVRFPQLHWNGTPGNALIRVTAVKGAAEAAVLIQQTLTAYPNATAPAMAKPSAPIPPSAVGTPPISAVGTPPISAVGTPPISAVGTPPRATVVAPFGPSATPTQPPATETAVAAPAPPVPGTPASPSGALPPPAQTASTPSPSVSVTDTSASTGGTAAHAGISKKWILLAVVAAGAGVGAALAMSGHGSSTTAAAAGLSIGSPTLSIGH